MKKKRVRVKAHWRKIGRGKKVRVKGYLKKVY